MGCFAKGSRPTERICFSDSSLKSISIIFPHDHIVSIFCPQKNLLCCRSLTGKNQILWQKMVRVVCVIRFTQKIALKKMSIIKKIYWNSECRKIFRKSSIPGMFFPWKLFYSKKKKFWHFLFPKTFSRKLNSRNNQELARVKLVILSFLKLTIFYIQNFIFVKMITASNNYII